MQDLKDLVPQKRPHQPPQAPTADQGHRHHHDRIHTEDVDLLQGISRQEGHAAGCGEEGADDGGDEVVAAAGLA